MDPHYALALRLAPEFIYGAPWYSGKSNRLGPRESQFWFFPVPLAPSTGHIVTFRKAGSQFLHLHIEAIIYDGFTGP